jgi:hypothetical protein
MAVFQEAFSRDDSQSPQAQRRGDRNNCGLNLYANESTNAADEHAQMA